MLLESWEQLSGSSKILENPVLKGFFRCCQDLSGSWKWKILSGFLQILLHVDLIPWPSRPLFIIFSFSCFPFPTFLKFPTWATSLQPSSTYSVFLCLFLGPFCISFSIFSFLFFLVFPFSSHPYFLLLYILYYIIFCNHHPNPTLIYIFPSYPSTTLLTQAIPRSLLVRLHCIIYALFPTFHSLTV